MSTISEQNLSQIYAKKKDLRSQVKRSLDKLSASDREKQGIQICNQVLQSAAFKNSKSICLYINMPSEVPTKMLLDEVLKPGSDKKCYVPKIVDLDTVLTDHKHRHLGMLMLRVYSQEDLQSFPDQSYKTFSLKEPTLEYNNTHREYAFQDEQNSVDLVIVPGLAFDSQGGRLGRGKGYYDKFLQHAAKAQKKPPHTIGVGFSVQKVEEVPVTPTDYKLDEVIIGSEQ